MEMETLFRNKQYRWVSNIFFGAAETPEADLRTSQDISAFLNARVGDLNWGMEAQKRQQTKDVFVRKVGNMFGLYDLNIPVDEVRRGLQNEGQKMRDLVTHLCAVSKR